MSATEDSAARRERKLAQKTARAAAVAAQLAELPSKKSQPPLSGPANPPASTPVSAVPAAVGARVVAPSAPPVALPVAPPVAPPAAPPVAPPLPPASSAVGPPLSPLPPAPPGALDLNLLSDNSDPVAPVSGLFADWHAGEDLYYEDDGAEDPAYNEEPMGHYEPVASIPRFLSAEEQTLPLVTPLTNATLPLMQWLKGGLQPRYAVSEFRNMFPRPAHALSLPAEPEPKVARFLQQGGFFARSVKADAELRDLHATLLRAMTPLYTPATLNEQRPITQQEISDVLNHTSSAMGHAIQRVVSLRRKAFLAGTGLDKVQSIAKKLESAPLDPSELVPKSIEPGRTSLQGDQLVPLFGAEILREIKDSGGDSKSFSADVRQAVAAAAPTYPYAKRARRQQRAYPSAYPVQYATAQPVPSSSQAPAQPLFQNKSASRGFRGRGQRGLRRNLRGLQH